MMKQQNLEILILQQDPQRHYKRDWIRMINKFKKDYFKNRPGWNPLTMDMVNWALEHEKGLASWLVYKGDECVAIAETALGSLATHRTMGVATIYVKPQHRGQGLAKALYDEIERVAIEMDCWFNIHIEQESLDNNRDKFIEMGYVTYEPIRTFTNGRVYQQKTFTLFRDYHLKRMKPLGNYKAGMPVEMGVPL